MCKQHVVTLRLLRGTSKHQTFTLSPSLPRAMFRVGTAIECNWQVHGPGVAPHHLMLLWKAGELTLVDVGAPDLYVDGESIELTRLVFEGDISFGSAAIRVERISKPAPLQREMPAAITTGIRIVSKKNS